MANPALDSTPAPLIRKRRSRVRAKNEAVILKAAEEVYRVHDVEICDAVPDMSCESKYAMSFCRSASNHSTLSEYVIYEQERNRQM